MAIQWTEAMRTGHPIVDADHMQLVELINMVETVVATGQLLRADQIMFSLLAYVSGHFAREEKVLAEIHYPNLEDHHAHHVEMANYAHGLNQEMLSVANDADRLAAIGRLNDSLQKWLVNHVMNEDLLMVPYLGAGYRREDWLVPTPKDGPSGDIRQI